MGVPSAPYHCLFDALPMPFPDRDSNAAGLRAGAPQLAFISTVTTLHVDDDVGAAGGGRAANDKGIGGKQLKQVGPAYGPKYGKRVFVGGDSGARS